MSLCCFSLTTSEIFQITHLSRYQFVGEVMMNILSTEEITHFATLGIPKGKNAVSILIAFGIDIFIRKENITLKKPKTKTV